MTNEDEGTRHIARGFHGRAPLSLLILAVGSSLALILMDATPLDTEFIYPLFAMSGMVIVWAVIGLWSATLCIRCARQRSWKQSVLPGFLLVSSFLVAFNFFFVCPWMQLFRRSFAFRSGTLVLRPPGRASAG
jgi:hypothetical protein